MANGRIDNKNGVHFLIAVGGNGVRNAIAFIMHCFSTSKNYGKVYICIHDADRANGDCNELKMLAENYKVAHRTCENMLARTEIILMEENLADCMKSAKLKGLVKKNDPRSYILNGSTDQVDREMNLLEGQYGRADIGAFNNIARKTMYADSTLVKTVLKVLGDGKEAYVIATGSITGGTGASYTLNDVTQIKDVAMEHMGEKNLHTGVALLGPCTSNPKPSPDQLKKIGKEYDVDSNEAFSRASAALDHMSKIHNLMPDANDPNKFSYLNRLYYVGNPSLDPGQKEWKKDHQEAHPTHFLHYALGMSIGDFFENGALKLAEGDTGVRIVRVNDGNHPMEELGWNSLPSECKSEIITAMRFSYVFRMELVPLFALSLEGLKNNRVTNNWFVKGGLRKKLLLNDTLLDKLVHNIDSLSAICKDYIQCFYDIQGVSEFGTGRKMVHLFEQEKLESHLKKNFKTMDSFTINQKDYCTPDELTMESDQTLRTGLKGTVIMDILADNRELCNALQACCNNLDLDAAALEMTQLIAAALYEIVKVGR